MTKIEIGLKVLLKAVGNNARGRKEVLIKEGVIRKIGRKFFEVWRDDNERYVEKFYIENNKHVSNTTPDWQLYFSEQDMVDEEEFFNLQDKIRKFFNNYGKVNLTLDQLRKISEIIDTLK